MIATGNETVTYYHKLFLFFCMSVHGLHRIQAPIIMSIFYPQNPEFQQPNPGIPVFHPIFNPKICSQD